MNSRFNQEFGSADYVDAEEEARQICNNGASSYLLRQSLMGPNLSSGWLSVAPPMEAPVPAKQEHTEQVESSLASREAPNVSPSAEPDLEPSYPISNASSSSSDESEYVTVDPLAIDLDRAYKLDPAKQPLHSPALSRLSFTNKPREIGTPPTFLANLNRGHSSLVPDVFEHEYTPPHSMSNSSLYFGLTPSGEESDNNIAWADNDSDTRRFRLDDSMDSDLFAELRKQVGAMHGQSQEQAEDEMEQHSYHNDMLSRLNEAVWG